MERISFRKQQKIAKISFYRVVRLQHEITKNLV
jgi:hypothetical protein